MLSTTARHPTWRPSQPSTTWSPSKHRVRCSLGSIAIAYHNMQGCLSGCLRDWWGTQRSGTWTSEPGAWSIRLYSIPSHVMQAIGLSFYAINLLMQAMPRLTLAGHRAHWALYRQAHSRIQQAGCLKYHIKLYCTESVLCSAFSLMFFWLHLVTSYFQCILRLNTIPYWSHTP